jgi:hypothetical protein
MRKPTACDSCRRAKRRCIQHPASEACTSCVGRRLICKTRRRSHSVHQRILTAQPPASTSNDERPIQFLGHGDSQKLDVPHGVAIELVDIYLDRFDGRPHSIFHAPTLRSHAQSGHLKASLLYAICAISSKFSANPDLCSLGPSWMAESKRLLQADITNICLDNIRACILVATYSVGHGDSRSEALFFSM